MFLVTPLSKNEFVCHISYMTLIYTFACTFAYIHTCTLIISIPSAVYFSFYIRA